ncbi:hypothetical protein [Bradyrhizobium algeriense]|uniref:hypothetical protein n=1 Tax=Bradyrhizobium algeriense TaxID=634784 RepID=UPI00167C642A|nr:hypothetical protein [Bradyrhizobium algeriense]
MRLSRFLKSLWLGFPSPYRFFGDVLSEQITILDDREPEGMADRPQPPLYYVNHIPSP